jgi:flagellar motility protein MotE (MotC chaperone)/CBS domain-containing protein/sporulation protein YlmC with PRC-barrel domain
VSSGRVFVARLAGLPVFDPNGDPVGRARDVVVALRPGGEAPRVLGMVLEVQGRRRIFVPMGRVTSVDSDAVILSTGSINMRRFEQRAGETLVLSELLDRSVTIVDDGSEATVVDVSMEQTRTDWLVTKVAVRKGRGRRRSELLTVDWDEITGLGVPEHEQGAANLLAVLAKLRPADLAGVLHDLSDKRRGEIAAALDDERLADVLEEMPEDEQVELLSGLADERAADVLEAMAPDDAADLLGEMQPADAERLLELMEPDEAEPVRQLLAYGEDTAGGLMTSEPVILGPGATVAEALARIRHVDIAPSLAAQVYVVRPPFETPTGRYLGTAHFQRLLREPPSTLLGAAIETDIDPLPPECPLHDVTRHLATYNLVAVPIVDTDGHLLGAVTVDDVLDHVLPDDWREGQVRSHG